MGFLSILSGISVVLTEQAFDDLDHSLFIYRSTFKSPVIFLWRFCLVPIRNEMEDAFYLTLDEKLLSMEKTGQDRAKKDKEGIEMGLPTYTA